MTTPQQIFIEMVESNPIVVKMKDPLMVVYVVDGIGDRNNIDEKVRYEGMIVFVKENGSNYTYTSYRGFTRGLNCLKKNKKYV